MKHYALVIVCVVAAGAASNYAAQAPPKFLALREQRIPNQYIVVLHDVAASGRATPDVANELSRVHGGQRLRVYRHALNGFSVRLSEAGARKLSEDPRVKYVQEDGVAHGVSVQLTPGNVGLDRIDQRRLPLDNSYSYFADGTGVNAYILDSGIRVTHASFGGRAYGAFSAVDDGIPPEEDCAGHGTHVAGIVGSSTSGVAKNVRLFSVRVLGCSNTGSLSDVIEGLDWIAANAIRPAVINASIIGPIDTAVAEAIDRVTAAGITYVGAAGNYDGDACSWFPGAVPSALTVGASTADDLRADFSNWGACVDVFAPGYAIESASSLDDTSLEIKYGTSMSAPFVAGALALVLQRFPAANPSELKAELLRGATRGVLTGLPAGTPNVLLFTPYLGDALAPSVALTSPGDGAAVGGTVSFAAAASDNVEIQSVNFFVGNTQVASDTAAPYTVGWNSTSVPDGSYVVRARAVDLAGNTRDVTATVNVRNGSDTTPPSVSMTTPESGTTLAGVVTVQASANDNLSVARVEFMVDGSVIDTDATAPYSVSWNTTSVSNGSHTLLVRAFDSSSNSKLSTPVNVDIENGAATDLPSGWSHADVGVVRQVGSASYVQGTFGLQAGGLDIWSTSDAFHYTYRSWTGDGDVVARVASLQLPVGASFAMAGVMFRESLAADARHASVLIGTNGKLKFRRRATTGGETLSDGPSEGSVAVPHWLKISRRGNAFTAYRSADGIKWIQVGPTTTIALPSTVHVGVWALRNGGTALTTTTFGNVTVNAVSGPLPAAWSNIDVGAVGQSGSAAHESGTFGLLAGGEDVWSTSDAFHYAYRTWTGDGDIVARVANLPLPVGAEFAMAGVMFRESLAPNVRHASLLIGTNGKLKFRRRTVVGGVTLSDGPSEGSVGVPYWLKVSRRGNVFTAYRSIDGVVWVQVGPATSLAMPATVHVGIWALRKGGTALAEAVLTNVGLPN